MKRLLVLLALLSIGCASLRLPNGHLDVMKIISDARWGVLAACSQEWLSPPDCLLTEDALTIADGIVAKNVPMIGQAVRAALVDFEQPLPPTSRVRPYLDAVIAILAA